jgi:hypothetical protein
MHRNRILRAGLTLLSWQRFSSPGRAPTQNTPPPVAPPGLEKIQHFVCIMQENRSFDHYFGTYLGAEGPPPGVCVSNPAGGPCIAPSHDAALVNQRGAHNWANALNCIDGGMMDGFVAGSAKPGEVVRTAPAQEQGAHLVRDHSGESSRIEGQEERRVIDGSRSKPG